MHAGSTENASPLKFIMLPEAVAVSPVIERNCADASLRKRRTGKPNVNARNLKTGEIKNSNSITVQLVFPMHESTRNKTLKIKPRKSIERVPTIMESTVNIIAGIK